MKHRIVIVGTGTHLLGSTAIAQLLLQANCGIEVTDSAPELPKLEIKAEKIAEEQLFLEKPNEPWRKRSRKYP